MREERAPGLWGNREREIAVNTHIWCWIEEELTLKDRSNPEPALSYSVAWCPMVILWSHELSQEMSPACATITVLQRGSSVIHCQGLFLLLQVS